MPDLSSSQKIDYSNQKENEQKAAEEDDDSTTQTVGESNPKHEKEAAAKVAQATKTKPSLPQKVVEANRHLPGQTPDQGKPEPARPKISKVAHQTSTQLQWVGKRREPEVFAYLVVCQ
jgi:hypothetical protein